MNEHHKNSHIDDNQPKRFSVEQFVLFASLICFLIFLWLMTFLLWLIASGRPFPVALPPAVVEIAATQGFVLPPTWTPTPEQTLAPTPTPSQVWDGTAPTRIYTPRPTSLGLPMLLLPPQRSAVDLARIMQGESPGDPEAAYMVGWVAKNRLLHSGYGDTYNVVSHGFFGYRVDMEPNREFLALARRVIRSREDPTGGALYALSRTDITKLGIPPHRADVAYGEWFFFKTWPLSGR